MAANIEHIFQDFILNKIREIEDQQEDNGPVKALAADSYTSVKTEPDSERDEKEKDSHGAALKKHKKHKKHKSKKSKKKKKKRDREEKESSSESGVESEGQAKRRSSRTPGEETNDGDGNRKASRHKQHLVGKKKIRKRRKEDGQSSSDSESEGSQKGGSRCPGSSSQRKEDLPDIIPKQDSSKKGGANSEKGGGRSHTSRSRVWTHSRSRSARRAPRSRSRSARRAPRSRSRSRPRGRRSRSRSRSRHGRSRSTSRSRRGRSRSTSRSRRGRTRSRSRRGRTRSTSRSRRGRTRSTSRSRQGKTRSTSRSRSQLGIRSRKTKSRSHSHKTRRSRTRSGSVVRGSGSDKKPSADPVATETEPPDSRLPGIELHVTDPVVDPSVPTPVDTPIPSLDPSPAGAVAANALGSWKPLPPLEVVTSASLPQKGVPAQPPEGLASEPVALHPVPGEEVCGAAGEDSTHVEPQSTDPGADASAQRRGEDTEEASPLQKEDPGPPPGPCNLKSSPVPPGADDPGHNRKSPGLPEKPNVITTVADGNDSSSKSSTQRRRPSSKSPPKKKEAKKSSRLRSRSNSRSRRRSSRSGSRPRRTGSKRKRSGSRRKRSGSRRKRSGSRRRRSGSRRRRTRSKSRSRKKSKSRSPARRPKRSRSGSPLQRRGGAYGGGFSQRDRWKREPSRSPVLILRKNRSPAPKNCSDGKSPSRITELDKDQLLEIAKANAAAMCTKAGVPIPESLKPRLNTQMQLPLAMPLPNMAMNAAVASMAAATMTAALSSMGALASMPPLPSITNKPPPGVPQMDMAALEVVKKKVTKQANSISIKEFTDKCKMIVDSKGELPVAQPHVSDEEDEGKPFGSAALREQKAISFSINNMSVRPAARSDAGIAKEFPVSSGSQHRKKEGEAPGAYGEWVPVEKMSEKAAKAAAAAVAAAVKAAVAASVPSASSTSSPQDTAPETPPPAAAPAAGTQAPAVPASDSVFPEPPLQPVDISQAVTERIKAQRRLAENPYDVSAISMLSRAQEQVDAWAQSNSIPGLFTGSTGATVLSSEELSNSGPQAWLKKDQFLRAAPVSGGVGEFLMRKMGWKTGEGLGRNREGTVEPIIIDFKIDRKGLVANGEKPQKQTGGLVVTKDLMGKHPVSALIELCNKRHIMQPDFVMVHHSGPDHRKNFLFKVTVNSVDYQPQTASPNKKHAKAMAAMVALQGLGEVPADGPGLYTGPVFTAASTGPLFST